MTLSNTGRGLLLLLGVLCGGALLVPTAEIKVPAGREVVVFWHFWGGADRDVVEQVVDRFNHEQARYWVRPIAMPGNNLDLKLFLAVTGGDPPDLINQDDPIMADWAARGALMPLDELATKSELEELRKELLPAAQQLATFRGRYYALCNGLDIRALFYNRTLLDELGLAPPNQLEDLDRIAEQATEIDARGQPRRFGYLPDPRRLWAWGVVFGGSFYDPSSQRATANDPPIKAALRWMTTYRKRYGTAAVAAFRQGDQSLPGKSFPLLAGRYAVVMDGQWRVRDILASQAEQERLGKPVTQFGVCPLPPPPGGRSHAGWANGNLFLVPRNAKTPLGSWEFMKFWCGFGGHEQAAVQTCLAGGWIPVSRRVVEHPQFQDYLRSQPMMATFVELARSTAQLPTPVIPGAGFFQRTINQSAATAMYVEDAAEPDELLDRANQEVQQQLQARGAIEW